MKFSGSDLGFPKESYAPPSGPSELFSSNIHAVFTARKASSTRLNGDFARLA
jgi:hypothetical protein